MNLLIGLYTTFFIIPVYFGVCLFNLIFGLLTHFTLDKLKKGEKKCRNFKSYFIHFLNDLSLITLFY